MESLEPSGPWYRVYLRSNEEWPLIGFRRESDMINLTLMLFWDYHEESPGGPPDVGLTIMVGELLRGLPLFNRTFTEIPRAAHFTAGLAVGLFVWSSCLAY